jgi:hypothetical protein
MPIRFTCSCGARLQAQEEHAGRRVRCPACGTETTVPLDETLLHAVQAAGPPSTAPTSIQATEPSRPTAEAPEENWPRCPEPVERSGKATAALWLGWLSFGLNVLAGLPAVVLAIVSLAEIRRSRGRLGVKGWAVAGLVLGCLGPLCSGVAYWYVYGYIREVSEQAETLNHLKAMALAMHTYHDTNNGLPRATPDPRASPRKLSWRAELLPFLGEQDLADQLHFDEPWDSPHNKALLTPMPKVFQHPRRPEENALGLTYFRVFTGPDTPFPPGRACRIPADFEDGTCNTILIVEAAEAVPWTKPDELAYDADKPIPKLGGHFKRGFNVVMADGEARFVRLDVTEEALRRAINPCDGIGGQDW